MRQKIRQNIGIALLIVVGLGMISHFLGLDATFAADPIQTSLLQDLQSKLNTYNIIMNVVYILLRPGLILAGMSLDNNMVYGAFFKLDAPLWVIWNIIKNFANFALGFMVLVEVIKMVFNFGEEAQNKIFEVIKTCIIAGIGIQASWFLLAATIDLSTIATYGIGGLPLSVLGTSQDASIQCLANQKVLGVASTMDFTNSQQNGVANQGFKYYYYVDAQGGRKNYSPCKLKDNYVVGRQYGGPNALTAPANRNTGDAFIQPNFCILGANRVVHFNKEIAFDTLPPYQAVNEATMTPSEYSINIQNWIPSISNAGTYTRTGLQQQQRIFDMYDQSSYSGTNGYGIFNLYAIPTTDQAFTDFNSTGVLTMKKLLDSSKGMMGPLITLYSSILNFAQFNIQTSNGDDRALVIEALIKVLLAVAMFLPILLTALVMLVRVGILWVVIALSPFFVLKRTFHDTIGDMKDIAILKYGPGDLIKVIFAPVVIVFAVSLCIIFMSLLVSGFNNHGPSNPCATNTKEMYRTTFDVDEYLYSTGQTLKVGNLFELSNKAFGSSTGGDARDYIGWILMNLFGIGIVWMILMAALSFSEDLGNAIGVESWKKGFTNTIGSIPFIPVPTSAGMGFVGAKSFADVSKTALSNAASKTSLDGGTRKAFEDLAYNNNTTTTDNTNTTVNTNTNTGTAITPQQTTAIEDAIKSGDDRNTIAKNYSGVKDIDTEIRKISANLATDPGKQKEIKKDKLKETVQNLRDTFKQKESTRTKEEYKKIMNNPDNKLAYMLRPELEPNNKKVVELKDGLVDVLLKGDGSMEVTDNTTPPTDKSTIVTLDKYQWQWNEVKDLIEELDKIIASKPQNQTYLEEIKKFYTK